jgi:hypothetical protein
MTLGTCDGCAGLKRLRDDGTVPVHYLAIPVSRRAIPAVGAGRVRRRCPGSGWPPREATRSPGRPGASATPTPRGG